MWDLVERRPYLAVALLSLVLFLPGLFALPPIDRDEARFAQASKQMLETGDFVAIRFQDAARNKKPAGIYWLQATCAKLFETPPYDQIWAYRLPSLLGAIAGALLTLWTGKPLFGARAALLGAALLAASLMLGTEARLAKTDAVLLATILAAQGVLARAYLAPAGKPLSRGLALIFWAAMGAGILVKGPIAPLIVGLTALSLCLWDKGWAWLKQLRPLCGVLVLALIVAPWAIAIGLSTHGQFFTEAVGGDMARKLAGGQESHGAPPGTYVLFAILAFWPGTLFLLPSLWHAFRARKMSGFRFSLAWAGPAWLVFECVPTKLPHYVLPLYPALALLCGAAIEAAREGDARPFKGPLAWLALAGFGGAALALAVLLAAGRYIMDDFAGAFDLVPCILLLIIAGIAIGFMRRGMPRAALLGAIATAYVAYASAFGYLGPGLKSPWIAPRLVALLPRTAEGHLPPLIVAGYSEPSLVFLAGTGTQFLPAKAAADAFAVSSNSRTTVAVASTAEPEFRAEIAALKLAITPIGSVRGYNYSIGKPITLTLFRAAR